jgi:hypothetical protein
MIGLARRQQKNDEQIKERENDEQNDILED